MRKTRKTKPEVANTDTSPEVANTDTSEPDATDPVEPEVPPVRVFVQVDVQGGCEVLHGMQTAELPDQWESIPQIKKVLAFDVPPAKLDAVKRRIRGVARDLALGIIMSMLTGFVSSQVYPAKHDH